MGKKVIVYSTPICPECERAKKFLREKGIDYQEVDIFSDKEKAKEMIEKTGQKRVPVVEIGSTWIIGFDKKKIEEEISK